MWDVSKLTAFDAFDFCDFSFHLALYVLEDFHYINFKIMDRDAVEPNRKVRIEYHNLPEGKQPRKSLTFRA